jgi:hypothetical protein
VLFPAIAVTFDPREIWNRVEWADDEAAPAFRDRVSNRVEATR